MTKKLTKPLILSNTSHSRLSLPRILTATVPRIRPQRPRRPRLADDGKPVKMHKSSTQHNRAARHGADRPPKL